MTEKELEKIYSEAYRAVYWTAFQHLKNEADAEDIVQDTFVALIESYDTIEDKTKVTSWLKKTAANRSLNRLTRTKTDNEFRRCAYYYLDENGCVYKIRFFQYIGSDEEPILGMVTYSTPEAWQYWRLTDY